ncbi:MAG: hypothetical protein JOZ72_09535 [Alphaproteobacteria bacterium]|nr:hypothetical protein [Alphaproteobacteria bacterium]
MATNKSLFIIWFSDGTREDVWDDFNDDITQVHLWREFEAKLQAKHPNATITAVYPTY